MNKFNEILNRKVLGVKVLYLVGVGVAVLAFFAWKSKDTASPAAEVSDTDVTPGTETVTEDPSTGTDLSGYRAPTVPSGTVVVQNPNNPFEDEGDEDYDNSQWRSRAIGALQKIGVSTSTASQSVELYLTGAQLSIVQRGHIDVVLEEVGMPPGPSRANEVTYADVLAPVSPGVKNIIKWVTHASTPDSEKRNDIWAFSDNNTMAWISQEEWKGLGRPYVKPIPDDHVVWSYPVTRPKPGIPVTRG